MASMTAAGTSAAYFPVPPSYLASASAGRCDDCGDQGKLQQLRAQDARVRAMLLSGAAGASRNATVTSNISYTVGSDGQLYATGGTINTTRRINGVEGLASGADAADGQKLGEAAGGAGGVYSGFRPSFSDLQGIRLGISPLEFAKLFGEAAGEGVQRARLNVTDAAVRSQETLHFRAGGGLVSPPQYELQEGPDGESYAVAGSVGIATGKGSRDPQTASREAMTIAIAASAPGDASAQDMQVARGAFAKAAAAFQRAEGLQEFNVLDIAA